MESNRKPTKEEIKILEMLISNSSVHISEGWKNNLLVCQMDDGEMGSLSLFRENETNDSRVFDKQISEFQFIDSDGVAVIVSLNIDTDGNLYELDVWKTDFSRVIKFPKM